MYRVRRILLLADAVRRLGLRWAVFRVRYFFRHRSGALRTASPTSGWRAVEEAGAHPAVIDRDALRAHLAETMSPERLDALREHRARLDDFTFDIFATPTRLKTWHDDPTVDGDYSPDSHWSRVETTAGADIKRVWEPSRFTWAFDLARLHLVAPETGAADLFWRLLDDWMQQNQPNTGVNWGCGQEASFRLLSVIAAADAMADSLTDERSSRVRQLAMATAERVAMNVDYARSQANNHHASEAMGLITVGLLFADDSRAAEWVRLGERHLAEVCQSLVFADGGTSQYSTNYHRVFLHDFVWTAQVYRAVGRAVPDWLQSAGSRATRFLGAITEPISGRGPFFGPDDGARVLPLSASPHRHLADDVGLAAACFDVDVDVNASSEPAAWFGLHHRPRAVHDADRPAFVESFPDIGVHVLGCGSTRVYVRATEWRFRPAHDDQLHCDVWVGGENVVCDSGTATYHPRPNQPGPLNGSEYHNGPRLTNHVGMRHASKFLWAQWTHAHVVSLGVVNGCAVGVFAHEIHGIVMKRVVEVGPTVQITDTAHGSMEAAWLIDRSRPVDVEFTGSVAERSGSASDGYGTSRNATFTTVASVSADDGESMQIIVTPQGAR